MVFKLTKLDLCHASCMYETHILKHTSSDSAELTAFCHSASKRLQDSRGKTFPISHQRSYYPESYDHTVGVNKKGALCSNSKIPRIERIQTSGLCALNWTTQSTLPPSLPPNLHINEDTYIFHCYNEVVTPQNRSIAPWSYFILRLARLDWTLKSINRRDRVKQQQCPLNTMSTLLGHSYGEASHVYIGQDSQ